MSLARFWGFAAALALAVPAHHAVAQSATPSKAERDAARQAYDQGRLAFDRTDYVGALDHFVKANALIPSVHALYWIALAQDKLGRMEPAVTAYEAVTARADFSKLGDDKITVVRARLAALKQPPAPPGPLAPVDPLPEAVAAPRPAEPAPAATEPTPDPDEPPPSATTSAAPPPQTDWSPPMHGDPTPLPQAKTFELGAAGGMVLVSGAHNLVGKGRDQQAFEKPTWLLGVRAAYFPKAYLGAEAEYFHGFGHVKETESWTRGIARFDFVRGQVLAQCPIERWVPFALVGAGLWHGSSASNGAANDLAVHVGAGLKVVATRLLVPRFDFRLNVTEGKGSSLAVHPELLLGLSVSLGH